MNSAPETPKSSAPNGGRVLRLHFSCKAKLPLGSSLRVTSTTLVGGTLNDPQGGGFTSDNNTNLHHTHHNTNNPNAHYTTSMGQEEINLHANHNRSSTHSNSVEMMTTPNTYPIWKTKNPVIVVVNANDGGPNQPVQKYLHHRYRYLVVTPGAEAEEDELDSNISTPRNTLKHHQSTDDATDATMDTFDSSLAQETVGSMSIGNKFSPDMEKIVEANQVIMWEDPFKEEEPKIRMSNVSLPSLKKTKMKNLANLPYRTLSIPIATNDPTLFTNNDEEMVDGTGDEVQYTDQGIRIDVWNLSTDEAFKPYVEREQMRKNMSMQSFSSDNMISSISNEKMDDTSSGGINIAMDSSVKQQNDRLFLVCFHLPVILKKDPQTKTWNATWNESLLSKSPNSILEKTHDLHFVGHVTLSKAKGIYTDQDQELIRQALAPMGCTPLFLEEELMEAHYLGMCKQVLWPAFHNIDLLDLSTSGWGQREHLAPKSSFKSNPSSPGGSAVSSPSALAMKKYATNVRSTIESGWDQSILDKWWEAYTLVNQTFADKLFELLQPGDTIWVHDYHLALLPNLLDTKEQIRFGRRMSKMVFFLHIPFPTSQIFRELECGEMILQGMLHADVIGFHAFDHARHFLNAAKRILGLNYESLVGGLIGVQYRGKNVLVTMSNVSIEPDVVEKAMAFPSVETSTMALKNKHKDRVLIAGVDIAQRLSGITFKLLAFERLLTDYPVWKDKAVMVQRCLIPESRRADEANTIREVRFLIRRIQETFGRHVIDYQEVRGSSLPIEQRLPLWRASDCIMLSPVREGLNMVPMEYVYARKAPLAPGVTIASEFSAVCRILNGALRVNPFDIQLTAANIDKALSMDMKEKESRRARDIDFVSNFPKEKWTRNVLRDLEEAARQGDGEDEESSEEKKQENDMVDSLSTPAFLAREYEATFTHLSNEEVTAAYNCTSRRAIFLDFNGTIVIKEPPGKYLKREILGTSGLKPPSSVMKALHDLVQDPRNVVYVVSGDAQENVENAIGHVPGLGLAASNGACFSSPVKPGETKRTWETFDLGVDWEAVKRVSLPVLSKYTARTNGSFVKLTHSSIGWSYYSCDPEWGSLQASHLVLELEAELQAFDVRFVTLKGIVEIVPRRLNKGLIVKKVLKEVGDDADFILCMGDDISDEKMFTSVLSHVAEMKTNGSVDSPSMDEDQSLSISTNNMKKPMYCYTVTVGKKASHASRFVDDARDVAHLLVAITGGKENLRSSSFDDMSNQVGGDFFA